MGVTQAGEQAGEKSGIRPHGGSYMSWVIPIIFANSLPKPMLSGWVPDSPGLGHSLMVTLIRQLNIGVQTVEDTVSFSSYDGSYLLPNLKELQSNTRDAFLISCFGYLKLSALPPLEAKSAFPWLA